MAATKFFDSATVKGAVVSGVISFAAVLVAVWLPSHLDAPKLREDVQRLEKESAEKTNKITELQTILVPFKTIAFQNFTGTEAERLSQLAIKLTEIQKGLEILSTSQSEIKAKSDQIDNLSKEAKKKTEELEQITTNAMALQKQLSERAEFTLLLMQASNDNRTAFDKLWSLHQSGEEPSASVALQAINEASRKAAMSLPTDLKTIGFDARHVSLADYASLLSGNASAGLKMDAIKNLIIQERFSKKERFQLLIETVKTTDSLIVLDSACRALSDEAKLVKNIRVWRDYVTWWQMNQGNYF